MDETKMSLDEFHDLNRAIRDAPTPQAWLAAAYAMDRQAARAPSYGRDRLGAVLPCARCGCWDTRKRVAEVYARFSRLPCAETAVCEDRVELLPPLCSYPPCPDRIGEATGIMTLCFARFVRWRALLTELDEQQGKR